MMKKILIMLFCLQLVSGNSFSHELTQIPNVLAHYKEHKSETPDLSFLDFLQLHYLDAKHQESDKARHTQLPLHHAHIGCCEVAILIPHYNNDCPHLVCFAHTVGQLSTPQGYQSLSSSLVCNRLLRPPLNSLNPSKGGTSQCDVA